MARHELPSEADRDDPTAQNTATMIRALFPETKVGPTDNSCPDCRKTLPLNVRLFEGISTSTKAPKTNPSFDAVVEGLKPVIGFCTLNDNRDFPAIDLNTKTSGFDLTLFRKWQNMSPEVIGLNGNVIPKIDLISIDVLARTIYGEMSRCFDDGIQYPMAMAKVAVNRADWIVAHPKRRSRFSTVKPHELKSPLTSVLTSPAQFSVWNKKLKGGPNHSLKHVLCPPAHAKKGYWKTNKGFSKKEADIWTKSLEIAAEAVLDPKRFKEKTKLVNEMYYTSNVSWAREGYIETETAVGSTATGRIDNDACMMTWVGVDE